MQTVKVQKLEARAFKPFGWVIVAPDGQADIETGFVQYWHDVVDLTRLKNGMIGFLKVKRVPLAIDRLEMLPNGMELYISTDGLPSVMAVAPPDPLTGGPDIGRLSAFVLENGVSPVVAPGIWHWNPFPLSETAHFALVIQREVIIQGKNGWQTDPNEVRIAQFEQVAIAL